MFGKSGLAQTQQKKLKLVYNQLLKYLITTLSFQSSDYFFRRLNANVGIVITDTFGRPWRLGQVNVAIGLNKVPATIDEKGKSDISGRSLKVTEPAFADEIAAASGLVIKKDSKTPIVILQGLIWKQTDSNSKDLIRKVEEDMFR